MTNVYALGDVRIRRSLYWDIEMIEGHLRPCDALELKRSLGISPRDALLFGLMHSNPCYTVLVRNTPVAMFGVHPHDRISNAGIAWFIATDGIREIKKTFVKLSKRFIQELNTKYPVMFNYVDAENRDAIRWLRRCGAIIDEKKPYGVAQSDFHYFTFLKEYAHV